MKISSVTIEGMHKLGQPKKYTFNNLTYLYGPNGSGKSTVLEAIQLALLGYIPGMNKKNDYYAKSSNGISFIKKEILIIWKSNLKK